MYGNFFLLSLLVLIIELLLVPGQQHMVVEPSPAWIGSE